jgi:hypothetical protein
MGWALGAPWPQASCCGIAHGSSRAEAVTPRTQRGNGTWYPTRLWIVDDGASSWLQSGGRDWSERFAGTRSSRLQRAGGRRYPTPWPASAGRRAAPREARARRSLGSPARTRRRGHGCHPPPGSSVGRSAEVARILYPHRHSRAGGPLRQRSSAAGSSVGAQRPVLHLERTHPSPRATRSGMWSSR